MSPDEITLLQHVGITLVGNNGISITICTLYGFYLLVFLTAMFDLLKTGLRTTSSKILVVVLVLTFFAMTGNFICNAFLNVVLTQYALIKNPDLPLDQRLMVADEVSSPESIASIWLAGQNGLMYLFGDLIVVWRAWVLCRERRAPMILPVCLLIASFGLSLATGILFTIQNPHSLLVSSQNAISITQAGGMAASLATNFTATMLIAYQAYRHRQFLLRTTGDGSSKAWKILLYLTESGVFYCVLQAVDIGLVNSPDTSQDAVSTAAEIWGALVGFFSAIYPPLVILIVNHSRSIAEDTGVHVHDNNKVAEPEQFNPGTHVSFATPSRVQDSKLTRSISDSVGAGRDNQNDTYEK